MEYDLVVIVRGGGSQTDLNWFDNYELGFFITQFPVPVITGIGHDKDLSVTDIVAARNCKTPTAAADLIIETTSAAENYLQSLKDSLVESTDRILKSGNNKLDTFSLKLMPVVKSEIVKRENYLRNRSLILENGVRILLKSKEQLIFSKTDKLINSLKYFMNIKRDMLSEKSHKFKIEPARYIDSKRIKIDQVGALIYHLSPENVLKRGYSITLNNDNCAIKETKTLKKGDKVRTILFNGELTSEIFEISKKIHKL